MPDGMLRQWADMQPVTPPADFQAAIGGHPLVAEILHRRGIRDIAAAARFLNSDAYLPCGAQDLPGMQPACERIELAVQRGEKICVWGDFDVDGQTSTTLLVSALRALYGDGSDELVNFHIPVRARESHGVNWEYLEPILRNGTRLVVTCDTGISSHEPLAQAKKLGVDVIVTDHHDLPSQLPEVFAAVNPKLLAAGHPLSGLPGVGVAYKLVEGLYTRAGRSAELDGFLDLAALGIVADLASQTNDTRYLLQRGLRVLREARRVGIAMMLELSGLQRSHLTEEHIGFVLGPRLNALGRLEDANPAVELLTTTDEGRARVLATHLEGLNARRRLLTEQVLKGALAQIEKDPALLQQAALVLSHSDWPAGVIGIVASELAERFNRPTILISAPPGQPARGSARSIEGVHITEAISANQQLLHGFGGHPMAAGLSLDSDKISAFRRGLSRSVEKALGGTAPRPTLSLDGWVSLPEINLELVSQLERMAPFGTGNPPVVLAVPRLTILSSSTIGRDGDHIQAVVKDEQDTTRRVIWWRGAGWPMPEGMFDLACVLRSSNFRGQQDVQVEWMDARPVDTQEIYLRSPISVIDQRDLTHPLPVLQSILSETDAVVWGEAEARELISAQDRTEIGSSETLIVWTSPPGGSELDAVLQKVKPRTVVVFGVDPQAAGPEAFLKRLAGLAKYVIDKKNGKANLSWLAAATAQRESSIRLGLLWLEQRGMLSCLFEPAGSLLIQSGSGAAQPGLENTLGRLRILLEETEAYRHFFKTADKDKLF